MRRRSTRQGQALLLVLMLVALLAVASSVFATLHFSLHRSARGSWHRAECESAARSGIEHALWELEAGSESEGASGSIAHATYQVQIQPVPGKSQERELISTGTRAIDGGATLTRRLRCLVRLDPSPRIVRWLDE